MFYSTCTHTYSSLILDWYAANKTVTAGFISAVSLDFVLFCATLYRLGNRYRALRVFYSTTAVVFVACGCVLMVGFVVGCPKLYP